MYIMHEICMRHFSTGSIFSAKIARMLFPICVNSGYQDCLLPQRERVPALRCLVSHESRPHEVHELVLHFSRLRYHLFEEAILQLAACDYVFGVQVHYAQDPLHEVVVELGVLPNDYRGSLRERRLHQDVVVRVSEHHRGREDVYLEVEHVSAANEIENERGQVVHWLLVHKACFNAFFLDQELHDLEPLEVQQCHQDEEEHFRLDNIVHEVKLDESLLFLLQAAEHEEGDDKKSDLEDYPDGVVVVEQTDHHEANCHAETVDHLPKAADL
jgi:hypothetical protein